jgi:hypothetical protein
MSELTSDLINAIVGLAHCHAQGDPNAQSLLIKTVRRLEAIIDQLEQHSVYWKTASHDLSAGGAVVVTGSDLVEQVGKMEEELREAKQKVLELSEDWAVSPLSAELIQWRKSAAETELGQLVRRMPELFKLAEQHMIEEWGSDGPGFEDASRELTQSLLKSEIKEEEENQ